MSMIERCSAATPLAAVTPMPPIDIDSPHIHKSDKEDQGCSIFIPEDIVKSEILPRLHIKTLYRFKCISKQYRSIVSSPAFARNYLQRAYTTSLETLSSSGLLATLLYLFTIYHPYQDDRSVKALTYIIGVSNQDQHQPSITLSSISLQYSNRHVLVASSNGLLLSYFYANAVTCRVILCVSNPLTKQCVKLPSLSKRTYSDTWEFGIATRPVQTEAFLTYKVVAIERSFRHLDSDGHPNFSVHIFSSDTGSWSTWEARCPGDILTLPAKGCFVYQGIMHLLDRDTVITYDPYDRPDYFGRICLPNDADLSNHQSLIYSGDEETVKFCELVKAYGVYKVSMWLLVDDSDWCLEGEFQVPSLYHKYRDLMLALDPWNRLVMCHPDEKTKYTVIDVRTGPWKLVDVFGETRGYYDFDYIDCVYQQPLVPIKLCPWSSPFYAQAS